MFTFLGAKWVENVLTIYIPYCSINIALLSSARVSEAKLKGTSTFPFEYEMDTFFMTQFRVLFDQKQNKWVHSTTLADHIG